MAKNDISMRIGVEGEKEFKQSMSDIVQTSKTLASEMKLVESSFGKNASAQKKTKAQAEVLTKQIANQEKQVALLRDRYEKAANSNKYSNAELLKMKENLNKAETQLNKMNAELAETEKKAGGFKNAVSKMGEGLKKGLASVAKAAAVGVGAVATASVAVGKKMLDVAKETASAGDLIDKASQKLGMSAESYQKWDYVLGQSGIDISSMGAGLKTLTTQIAKASEGSGEAAERFAKLGISTTELKTLSREELFAKTIKGLQGMGDTTERAALANKLFGASGKELAPLLNQSAESTEELMKKAEELGFVMSDEAVKASANFQDALDTLGRTATGLKNKLGAELLPSLTQGMAGLTDILAGNVEEGATKINEAIAKLIGDILPKLVELIQGMLPSISTAITSILNGILKILPTLVSSVTGFLLNDFIPAILNMLPEIINSGLELIFALAEGIAQALPGLIPQIIDVVILIVETLLSADNISRLVDAALQIIVALGNGLIKAIPTLLKQLPTIITNIVKGLLKGLGQIANVGGQLISGLWNGIS